ncbi:TonB-dependent receptor [Polynucleobacter sp. AM-26B4]|uniref:TonB-dependent receptor family protein n=1 Tax=Polynucleobacter sp. AM-26B4 TaxID=2689103 RepID=UPI001C0E0D9B|nr:TonB-dependent receptor [Polynucleobacter sp. AM-26B4]MBU3584637.1 TonB-dependent receptor [Polynucleobacter sp. AM-26B4]
MANKYLSVSIATLLFSPSALTLATERLLDDVVVSSNRQEQKSFDAPASLQAVSREVIEDAGPQVNMSESLNRIPGVVALNRQNYAQDLQISIRGFGARTTFGVRGIRIIADGIPATIPDGQGQSATVSLTSTERIEVLRGPLAQLYGNSAGGVIQTFTREAPDHPELLVQGHTGSYGTNRTDWQYADKVGKFGLVADYSTFKTDGFRQNSQAERNQFNGKLTYQHNDQTKLDFIANIFDMPYGNDPAGLSQSDAITTPEKSSRVENQRKIIKQNQVGTVLTHAIDGVSKVSGRAYGGNREMTHFNNFTVGSPSWVGLNRDYYGLGLSYSSKTNLLGKNTLWVAGFDFDKSTEISQAGDATSNNAEKLNSNTRNEERTAQNTDFYAQGNMFLSEKWSILGGARTTKVKLASTNLAGTPASLGEVTFNAINPVIGVTYHASEHMNIYANYGRGLETPTLAEMSYDLSYNNTFNTALKASHSNHYEMGLKWVPNNRSRLDLAAFYVQTSDEIITYGSSGSKTAYTNSPGGTTRSGLELSYQNQFSSSMKLNITGTLIDAKFNENFTYGSSTVNAGNKIPGIPNGMAYSSIQWSGTDFQRNKYRQVMGTLATFELITAGANHSRDTNAESLKAGGYSLYNLRLAHRVDINSMTLTGYGQLNNLTDKKYIGSVIVGNSTPFEPAPGRNWMVGLNAITRF